MVLVPDHPGTILSADFRRTVGAEGINHQQFVSPANGLQRTADGSRRVPGREEH